MSMVKSPWLVGIFCFLLGGAVGFYVSNSCYFRKSGKMWGLSSEQVRAKVMNHLSGKLNLTDDQKPLVEEQVRIAQEKLYAIRVRVSPERDAIIREGISNIEKSITPEQKTALEEIYAKFKAKWERKLQPSPQE